MATDVAAPLPDLDWPDMAILSVNAGDASAVITGVVIHLSQDVPAEALKIPSLPPVVTYGPEAPGLTR